MTQYAIPCLHQSIGVASTTRVSDHHPLTTDEIRELLTIARTADYTVHPDIQKRLVQGIPGITCPQATSGPVHKKDARLSEIYVKWLASSEPVDTVLEAIDAIINGKG